MFVQNRKFQFVAILFASFLLLSPRGSCNKARKKANPKVANGKAQVKKMRIPTKAIVKTAVATGVFLVSKDHLIAAFQEENVKDPIEVVVMNPSSKDLEVTTTDDGKVWKKRKINGFESITIEGPRGTIGLNSGDDYYQMEEENIYTILQDEDNGLSFQSDQ